MKKKLDFKTIIIIVLLLGVIGFIIFWPEPEVDYNQDKIDELKEQNEDLLAKNDSLSNVISEKDTIIVMAEREVEELQEEVEIKDSLIQNINNRRDETRDHVNSLDGNDITRGINDYIRRNKSGN